MPSGRTSSYTDAIAVTICTRIANGESLRRICKDEQMPGMSTVMRWLRDREAFREQYAHAREAQLEGWADELVDIADSADRDSKAGVMKAKLQTDVRKWLMERGKPKKYGPRAGLEVTGKDGGPVAVTLADLVKNAGDDGEGDETGA